MGWSGLVFVAGAPLQEDQLHGNTLLSSVVAHAS